MWALWKYIRSQIAIQKDMVIYGYIAHQHMPINHAAYVEKCGLALKSAHHDLDV